MTKIIVFGASGGTGKQVVLHALEEGHEVTVVIRNPEAFTIQRNNLKIIKGDVLQPATFENEMRGHTAVISCLGIPKIQSTVLYSQGIKNIVQAMKQAGIDRILCISSGAISIPPGSSRIMTFLLKNVLQRLYKPVYSDMVLMENTLRASDLSWTVLRAPKLTDGKSKMNYRVITQQPLRSIPVISRADLAHYLVSHVGDELTYKSVVEIAY